MPGIKESRMVPADFLSAFSKLRAGVTAADVAVDDAAVADAEIDLSNSILAATNQIVLWGNRTAGTGNLAVTLYAWVEGMPADTWVIAATLALGAGTAFVPTTNLIAGKYRVVVTGVGASTWDLYVSHTDLPID